MQPIKSRVQVVFSRRLAIAAILALNWAGALAKDSTLHYLEPGRPDAAALLAAPPLPGSPEQAADMETVRAVSHAAGSNDISSALTEKKFSLANFAPAVGPFFQPGKLPKTETFFARAQKDAAAIVDAAKEHWKRPRPYTL